MCVNLCACLGLFNLAPSKSRLMTESKPGSSKRQLQERNFEVVVNHTTIDENQLPRVSRESITALKHVSGHNIRKYSGPFHHKVGNDHVHFPGRALDDKAQCKWSQQLSRQELQNFNERRMRSSKRLMEAAAVSVGCSTYALPMVLGYFGKVPKRQESGLICKPAYDEEDFKALPKEQQTCQQERSMQYLQGPNKRPARGTGGCSWNSSGAPSRLLSIRGP